MFFFILEIILADIKSIFKIIIIIIIYSYRETQFTKYKFKIQLKFNNIN